jgi:hypothetical protein
MRRRTSTIATLLRLVIPAAAFLACAEPATAAAVRWQVNAAFGPCPPGSDVFGCVSASGPITGFFVLDVSQQVDGFPGISLTDFSVSLSASAPCDAFTYTPAVGSGTYIPEGASVVPPFVTLVFFSPARGTLIVRLKTDGLTDAGGTVEVYESVDALRSQEGSTCGIRAITAGVVTSESPSPSELVGALLTTVTQFSLPKGFSNALGAKLNAALAYIVLGNPTGAVDVLNAFINSVEAQRGKQLSDSQANVLVTAARAIISALAG